MFSFNIQEATTFYQCKHA